MVNVPNVVDSPELQDRFNHEIIFEVTDNTRMLSALIKALSIHYPTLADDIKKVINEHR